MERLMSKDTRHEQVIVKMSNEKEPYHFVGSGLRNVYLVGVEYEVEPAASEQSAVIPCLPTLLEAIGKLLVEKKTPLSHAEIRFLRKRLRLSSKHFAELVGLSSEQYSRVENDAATVTPTVERVVRLLYAALAKLSSEETQEVAKTKWAAEWSHEERIIARRDKGDRWIVLTEAA
jgi:transcriptional regulator with XRE-family HTH domain